MKFKATQTRALQIGPRRCAIIKGQVYSYKDVKAFFRNGKTPEFLVEYKPSHIERYILDRELMCTEQGWESELCLAVYKAYFAHHNGDSSVLRRQFQLQRVKCNSLEKQMAKEFSFQEVEFPHSANDYNTGCEKVWDKVTPLTKSQEEAVIDRVLEILSQN